jgi:hypothetical protein
MLLALVVTATSFDRVVGLPSANVVLAQNVGPVPTPALNPRLGAPPPGGHLGERAGNEFKAQPGSPGVEGDAGVATRLGNPAAGGLGTMNGDRLGAPPVGAVPNAAAGAVAPPAAGAVAPPPAGAVAPRAGAPAPAAR